MRLPSGHAGLVAALVLAAVAGGGAAPPPAPRLANVYLAGSVDDAVIAALARWDVVVVSETWSSKQLQQLRALNPQIKIFMYVIAYAVAVEPRTLWSMINTAYVTANDLWWYDADGRVASDWPGTGMVNVTALAPQGAFGAWRDFWTQRVVALVQANPELDGIYLDNFWRQISWQQGRRRLDSDCNPRHTPAGCDGVADRPSRLDSLWHESLSGMAATLRQRFDTLEHPRPLALIANGASDYFQWLNGTLYEYFPSRHTQADYDNPYGYNWNREMFDADAGYLEAPFRAAPYRVSILNSEFYGDRWTPARGPTFERHKRFTLVSSLLGSGYYSLDAGHGGNQNLWWEPEYDHAGRGKGYLGRPRGAAVRLLEPEGDEMLQNPDFSSGTSGWDRYGFGAAGRLRLEAHSFRSPPAAARIEVDQVEPGGAYKVWQAPIQLRQHQAYTLSFWAKGPGRLRVHLYGETCPGRSCWGPQPFRLQSDWRRYETSFHSRGSGEVGLDFFVDAPCSLWIDDVSLRPGDTALFRRDFDHGIVLLNYTTRSRTVDLETTYHRLQVPGSAVFDGSASRRETIPPSDARILLRRAPTDAWLVPASRTLLGANRPNPFNPGTEIPFTLHSGGPVRLTVYDVAGRLVRVLLQETLPAGTAHRSLWDGRDAQGRRMPAGVYLYEIVTPGDRQSRKMILLR